MNIWEMYLTSEAKTQPRITIFEHCSDVLQVVNYLLERNVDKVQHPDLVRASALVHDVGKIAGDFREGQWVHSPHSAKYLGPLLAGSRFQELLEIAGVDGTKLDHDLLLTICEEHHNPSPKLLRGCKDTILVCIADALASSIESGVVGSVADILHTSPYLQVNLELVRSLGFDKGLDTELHRLDLPGQFVEDMFLASMIFCMLAKQFREVGIYPLLQKGSSLWVSGTLGVIHDTLACFAVDPRQLYESVFEEHIYDSILDEILAVVPAGAMQVDSLKYILVAEPIARRLAIALYTRKSVRATLDKYNLSWLADSSSDVFAEGLEAGIEKLWCMVRTTLLTLMPELSLPQSVTCGIRNVVEKRVSRSSLALVEPNKDVLKALETNDKKLAGDIKELLKLFDASGNYYRSVTNILLELLKMQAAVSAGEYNLPLAQVILLDGQQLLIDRDKHCKRIENAVLCPICRRFPQELSSQSLITGNPKMDSVYQTFRSTRGQIRVCRWCFLAGYVDLPIASIAKDGQSISKHREYLLVTSPVHRDRLQRLVDFVRRGAARRLGDGNEEAPGPDVAELAELEAMIGLAGGYDELAVLGISKQRLSHLKGFVLPMVNVLSNLVGIRIPSERLVGEDKVSGAVRRELVKATMYDLRLVTGAVSMHYNVIAEAPFSMDGVPIALEDMERASIAYRLADKDNFGRRFVERKGTWVLDSSLFILLLSDARKATNLALRKLRRDKRAPGEEKIKEVIALAEQIARGTRWKFDLGLRIVEVLVDVDLLPPARSFWKSQQEQFSGVELTKWLQRIKMARDETSLRKWGNRLINALKRGDVASPEFRQQKGIEVQPPGKEKVGKILDLVEEVITACGERKCSISELSRDIADMDYYLLFYYNQKAKEGK